MAITQADVDNIKLTDYKKIGEEAYDGIYRRKVKGSPKFISVTARGPAMEYRKKHKLKGPGVNNVTHTSVHDIRILVNEMMRGVYGPPAITGYGLGGWPAEKTYRGVKVGKYLLRDEKSKLPKFTARWTQDGEFVGADAETIPLLEKEIDKILDRK